MDGLYSHFATEEAVITKLIERGPTNSKKSTYWINLLRMLNTIDPEIPFQTMLVKQELRLY